MDIFRENRDVADDSKRSRSGSGEFSVGLRFVISEAKERRIFAVCAAIKSSVPR